MNTLINKNKRPKIAVIGGGSWATALVKILRENNNRVHWWMRNEEAINHLRSFKRNIKYLPGTTVNIQKRSITNKIKKVFRKADYVVLAVPAAFLEDALSDISAVQMQGKTVVSAIKGMIPNKNQIIGNFLAETYKIPFENICVISGPCHAEEVAQEKLSYLTISCIDQNKASDFAKMLQGRYIQTKVSPDIYGTEYSAVMKNIFALACGIAHGLGYGDNFQAVLVSNAIQEIGKFIAAAHPIDRDINESAYLGDLLVTAYSPFSRNRRFGNLIGRGYSPKSAMMEMNMVAEGYYATKSIYESNKSLNVDLPITNTVYRILYENKNPSLEMHKLENLLS